MRPVNLIVTLLKNSGGCSGTRPLSPTNKITFKTPLSAMYKDNITLFYQIQPY